MLPDVSAASDEAVEFDSAHRDLVCGYNNNNSAPAVRHV